MADDFGVEFSSNLDGIDELIEKLKLVGHETKYKGGRAALRKAANIVRDAAIANSQRVNDSKTPEDISKNIAIRWSTKRFKRTGNLGFRVGILGGAKNMEAYGEFKGNGKANPGGDTWYWRLQEFGAPRANVPAQKFIRPALAKNAQAATDKFVEHFKKVINKRLEEAGKL